MSNSKNRMIKEQVKITVLMSVYNGARHLKCSIESILCQTYNDFEFIIINDASTDNSKDIILSYKDSRIVYVENKENIGLTKSLIKGIERSKGKFIARQDADDISLPNRLEEQIEFVINNTDLVLIGSSAEVIYSKSDKKFLFFAPNTEQEIWERLLYSSSPFVHSSLFIKKSVIIEVGNYREIFNKAQDLDLILRIGKNYKISNIEKPLVQLLIRQDSMSVNDNKADQIKFAMLSIASFLLDKRRRINILSSGCNEIILNELDRWFYSSHIPCRYITQKYFRIGKLFIINNNIIKGIIYFIKAFINNPLYFYSYLTNKHIFSKKEMEDLIDNLYKKECNFRKKGLI